jgi:hypothetical protein
MIDHPQISMPSLRQRFTLWRYRLQSSFLRFRRGLLYGLGRLSRDDAQQIFIDCQRPAGWHSLLLLAVEDVLEEARETLEDHSMLPRLVNDACARLAHKWENYSDERHEAHRWAMDLIRSFAREENIVLRLRANDYDEDRRQQRALS